MDGCKWRKLPFRPVAGKAKSKTLARVLADARRRKVQARFMQRGNLIRSDAASVLRRLPGGTAQLVIAAPSYFQVLHRTWDRQWPDARSYLDWSLAWLAEAMRVLRADGLLYRFGQLGKREHTFLHLMSEAARSWQFHDLITRDRVIGYNVHRDSFTPATEMILVLHKSARPKFHKPAVREPYEAKTVKLIERIVLSSSAPGDLALELFSGSGTKVVVAGRHDRRWLGIEIDRAYVRMAKARIKRERAKQPLADKKNLDGMEKMVGAVRFELTTSCTRNKRASQATLRPEPINSICLRGIWWRRLTI